MNNINRIKIISFLLLLMNCITLFPQDSLMHYQQQAGKQNATVMQRYYEYQAASKKIAQVGGLPDPQLEIGLYLEPMEQLSGNRVADFKLMQMFPWFGVIKGGKDEMSWMAKARFESFRDAKLTLYFDVQKNWYDLYKAREDIRIAKQNLELLNTLERISLVKFRSGSTGSTNVGRSEGGGTETSSQSASSGMNNMGAKKTAPMNSSGNASMGVVTSSAAIAEVYQIQIEIGDVENAIEGLKNSEKVVAARFNALLNRSPLSSIYTPDSLSFESLDSSYFLLTDSSFKESPMLKMLLNEQESLIAKSKMQKSMGLPMIGLGLNYSIINSSPMSTSAMNGKDMIMPMVTLTLPIYRKKYNAMQSETSYLKEASMQNYQNLTNTLRTEYEEAMQLYNDARRRVLLYRRQSELTQKLLDIQIKTFSASGAGLSSVLRIRQQLFDYDSKSIVATVDFNTARAWMRRLKSVAEIE